MESKRGPLQMGARDQVYCYKCTAGVLNFQTIKTRKIEAYDHRVSKVGLKTKKTKILNDF